MKGALVGEWLQKGISAKHRVVGPWPAGHRPPNEVADSASYVGSAEHKDVPSSAGSPALRTDASRCDPDIVDFEEITGALRQAINRQCTSGLFEGDFPKYVWGWFRGRLYEARLTNRANGNYKGYPLEPYEVPKDDEDRLNWEEPDA